VCYSLIDDVVAPLTDLLSPRAVEVDGGQVREMGEVAPIGIAGLLLQPHHLQAVDDLLVGQHSGHLYSTNAPCLAVYLSTRSRQTLQLPPIQDICEKVRAAGKQASAWPWFDS